MLAALGLPRSLGCVRNPAWALEDTVDLAIAHFLEGNLHFFDAATGLDQCHVTAQIVVELYRHHKKDLECSGGKILSSTTNLKWVQFLASAFLLSHAMSSVSESVAKILWLPSWRQKRWSKKRWNKQKELCKNKHVRECAKKLLSQYQHQHLQSLAIAHKTTEPESVLLQESSIMLQDAQFLHLTKGDKANKLNRIPKFLGAFLIFAFQPESRASLLFHIRFLSPQHKDIFFYWASASSDNVSPEPVIAIDAVWLGNNLTAEEYFSLRRVCPYSNPRGCFAPRPQDRSANHTCMLCQRWVDPREETWLLQRESSLILQWLMRAAAHFTDKQQNDFALRIKRSTYASKLSELFSETLDSHSPFIIDHVHAEGVKMPHPAGMLPFECTHHHLAVSWPKELNELLQPWAQLRI